VRSDYDFRRSLGGRTSKNFGWIGLFFLRSAVLIWFWTFRRRFLALFWWRLPESRVFTLRGRGGRKSPANTAKFYPHRSDDTICGLPFIFPINLSVKRYASGLSGAIASGVGYSIWCAALLTTTRSNSSTFLFGSNRRRCIGSCFSSLDLAAISILGDIDLAILRHKYDKNILSTRK